MRALRLAVFAGAVMVAAPLSAQAPAQGQAPRGDPAAMQARQNEALFAGITLSAEQKTKIDSIQTASRTAQRAAMDAGGMQDPEVRQRMMAQRQATAAAVRGVLTAEQQVIYDRNLANMPAMRGGGRPPEGQRPPR
jgi:Spy/CpxP family protein refolding chaperone